MQAYSLKFGGGGDATILHPVILVLMLLAIVLFFVMPRRYAVAPLLCAIFLTPQNQQIYAAGVHLFVIRLVILAAFIRAVSSKEPDQKSLYAGGWTSIDTAHVCCACIVAVCTMVQYASVPALINQIGYLWDYLLGYLVLRSLVREERDIILCIKCLAGLMVIIAAAMVVEQMKSVNVFGMLGGVATAPEVRDGKVRSQGVFQHALTAGTFAAPSIPLFLLLWKNYKIRLFSAIGIVAATVMTMMTQTSTSLLTEAAGIMAVCMWPLRKKMKTVRIVLVVVLISLNLVMKAPVWFLIARIDLTGSSSSYHRAELINESVNHFSSWWLTGTKDAASWGWDMWDAQNMYVSVGEEGGLAALVFFILVISRTFGRLGNARKKAKSKKEEWMVWFLGSALFANVVAFFGVNYFDQSRDAWFLLIAMICAFAAPIMQRKATDNVPSKVVVNVQMPEVPQYAAQAVNANPPIQSSKNRFYLD